MVGCARAPASPPKSVRVRGSPEWLWAEDAQTKSREVQESPEYGHGMRGKSGEVRGNPGETGSVRGSPDKSSKCQEIRNGKGAGCPTRRAGAIGSDCKRCAAPAAEEAKRDADDEVNRRRRLGVRREHRPQRHGADGDEAAPVRGWRDLTALSPRSICLSAAIERCCARFDSPFGGRRDRNDSRGVDSQASAEGWEPHSNTKLREQAPTARDKCSPWQLSRPPLQKWAPITSSKSELQQQTPRANSENRIQEQASRTIRNSKLQEQSRRACSGKPSATTGTEAQAQIANSNKGLQERAPAASPHPPNGEGRRASPLPAAALTAAPPAARWTQCWPRPHAPVIDQRPGPQQRVEVGSPPQHCRNAAAMLPQHCRKDWAREWACERSAPVGS
eukprot:gene3148-biopygen3556